MKINVGSWMKFAPTLARPWLRELAIVDLSCHRALCDATDVLFPEVRELAARWGWTIDATRKLLDDRGAWSNDCDHQDPPSQTDPTGNQNASQ